MMEVELGEMRTVAERRQIMKAQRRCIMRKKLRQWLVIPKITSNIVDDSGRQLLILTGHHQ